MKATLQDGICPDLKHVDSVTLQQQFSAVTLSSLKAMAYLWRGTSVEVIRADNMPALESCTNSSTTLRCQTLAAMSQGRLSELTAAFEESALGTISCDWRQADKKQKQAWMKFFNTYKFVLDSTPSCLKVIKATPSLEKSIPDPSVLPIADAKLLVTLLMINGFLVASGLQFKEGAKMRDLFCSQEADCNIISTRVLDLLWQTGIENAERVEEIDLYKHTSLRVRLGNGTFVYFNNAVEFLPADAFDHKFSQVNPAWQILGSNLSETAIYFSDNGDFDRAIGTYHAALKIKPMSEILHNNLGVTFGRMGNTDGLIAEARKVLEIDQNNVVAHRNLGIALCTRGDLNGAFAEFWKVATMGMDLMAGNAVLQCLAERFWMESLLNMKNAISAFIAATQYVNEIATGLRPSQ